MTAHSNAASLVIVSILTQSEGWVHRGEKTSLGFDRSSFNPHPTRRLGASGLNGASFSVSGVSILTQPEGWVHRGFLVQKDFSQEVSILTQPEGWVHHGLEIG